jgi:hypothetical protein
VTLDLQFADRERLLKAYLYLLGFGLLGQGVISLILRISGVLPPGDTNGLFTGDSPHASIHTLWGLALLAALGWSTSTRQLAVAALVFAAFYIPLGILGLVVHHPFGLALGPRQNGFHLIVGPLALAVGLWAWPAALTAAEPSPSRP